MAEGRSRGPVLRRLAKDATWAALGRDVAGRGRARLPGGREGGHEAPHRRRDPPHVPAWAGGRPSGRAPRVRRWLVGRGRPAPTAVPPGPGTAARPPPARHRLRGDARRRSPRPLPRRKPVHGRGQGAGAPPHRRRAGVGCGAHGGEAADAAGSGGLRVRPPAGAAGHRLGALAVHAPADGVHPPVPSQPPNGYARRRALRDVRRVRRANGQSGRAARPPALRVHARGDGRGGARHRLARRAPRQVGTPARPPHAAVYAIASLASSPIPFNPEHERARARRGGTPRRSRWAIGLEWCRGRRSPRRRDPTRRSSRCRRARSRR